MCALEHMDTCLYTHTHTRAREHARTHISPFTLYSLSLTLPLSLSPLPPLSLFAFFTLSLSTNYLSIKFCNLYTCTKNKDINTNDSVEFFSYLSN